MHAPSYRSTLAACYLGNVVAALICNLTPLLFIILMGRFGLSFEQLGRLVLINFITQIVADLAFGRPADRWGIRPFIVLGHLAAFGGFVCFALTPWLMPERPFLGFVLATMLFSCGGGLLELLLSPIIQAIPGDAKAAAMSLLHSFYAWGFLLVVLGTGGMLWLFGSERWPLVVLLWSLVPLINALNFARVPLAPGVEAHHRTRWRTLFRSPFFLLALLAITLGGAAESSMSQWISAYAEGGLGLSKATGDLVGVCLFAAALGTGRVLYGKFGKKIDVSRAMFWGAVLAVGCYAVAALCPWPLVALLACALCGFGVSLLWPGAIVLAAHRFPLAGASMFGLMAAGGDAGSAFGPWGIGWVADRAPDWLAGWVDLPLSPEALGLRSGLLLAGLFPLLLIGVLGYWRRRER